jgi:hypothetical protein
MSSPASDAGRKVEAMIGPNGKCECSACHFGAGVCIQKMTANEQLDAFGFDGTGRVRTLGKGAPMREVESDGRAAYAAAARLFPAK